MTLKKRFASTYTNFICTTKKFSLTKIRNQSPVVYSADQMMSGATTRRCDYFVLCDCTPFITGIYVVEIKGAHPSINKIKSQIQSGLDFVSSYIGQNECHEFLPVLVAKAIPGSMRRKFLATRVQLRGRELNIKHVKTGGSLEKLTP